jgi:hypothetical protein
MPVQPEPPTVAQVVHRAAGACDPEDEDADLGDLLAWFEDADEPVTAVVGLDERLAEAVRAIDPEGDNPALEMARAVTLYLAHRRDEIGDDRDQLLRLAARAEYDAHPPERVRDWLADEGVAL